MKRTLFVVQLMLICALSFGQTNLQADQRVTAFFGQDKIDEWLETSPDSIRYYNFFVESSFEIWTEENFRLAGTTVKAEELRLSESALQTLPSVQQFNILFAKVVFSENQIVWYKVLNSDYYLKLQSLSYIRMKFFSGK